MSMRATVPCHYFVPSKKIMKTTCFYNLHDSLTQTEGRIQGTTWDFLPYLTPKNKSLFDLNHIWTLTDTVT